MNTSTTLVNQSRLSSSDKHLFQIIRSAVTLISHRMRKIPNRRKDYLALNRLDDRMLRDIGLGRSDILYLQNFGRHR